MIEENICFKFNVMLNVLMDSPNPKLAMLGKLVWKLVDNKLINISIVETVPSLSFAVMQSKSDEMIRGIIVCPQNWNKQVEDDPVYCIGGLIFVGSQCRDFWNGKFNYDGDNSSVIERAIAYEAEYLKTLKNLREVEFNDYQKKVFARYPEGLDSIPDLIYHGKNYLDAS